MTQDRRRQFGRSLARLAVAVVAMLTVGLVAGYVFGRTDSRRAAALLIEDFVADEPIGTMTAPPAPSSGELVDGAVPCGAVDAPLTVDQQIAAVRAGVAVVQYRDESLAADLAAWARQEQGVVLAPNPAVDEAIVATAWGRRMRLTNPNPQLLSAFVTAYGGAGPDDTACRG